jgi:hypothetical protein
MRMLTGVMQRCSSVAFRLLGRRHSTSLILIGTLALAGSATLYLPQVASPAGNTGDRGQAALHGRAGKAQQHTAPIDAPTATYVYYADNSLQP